FSSFPTRRSSDLRAVVVDPDSLVRSFLVLVGISQVMAKFMGRGARRHLQVPRILVGAERIDADDNPARDLPRYFVEADVTRHGIPTAAGILTVTLIALEIEVAGPKCIDRVGPCNLDLLQLREIFRRPFRQVIVRPPGIAVLFLDIGIALVPPHGHAVELVVLAVVLAEAVGYGAPAITVPVHQPLGRPFAVTPVPGATDPFPDEPSDDL